MDKVMNLSEISMSIHNIRKLHDFSRLLFCE